MMTCLYHQTTMTSLCHGTLIHWYTHYICSGHWLSRPFALKDKVLCSKYLLRSFQKCTFIFFCERPMYVRASIITLVNLANDDFALRIFNAWFQWKETISLTIFVAPFLGLYQLCNWRLLTLLRQNKDQCQMWRDLSATRRGCQVSVTKEWIGSVCLWIIFVAQYLLYILHFAVAVYITREGTILYFIVYYCHKMAM